MVGIGKVTIFRKSEYIDLSKIIIDPFNFNNCLVQIGAFGTSNYFFSGKTKISNIKFKNNADGVTCSILSHLNYAANENGGVEINDCTFEGPDNYQVGSMLSDPNIIDMPIVFISKKEEETELYQGAIYKDIKIHSNKYINSGTAGGLVSFILRTDNKDLLSDIKVYNNSFTSSEVSADNALEIFAGSYGSNNATVIVNPFFFEGLFETENMTATNNAFKGV